MAFDIQQVVTDKIIAAIEAAIAAGKPMPWSKSWRTDGTAAHHNAVSRRAYTGINALTTWAESMSRGYTSSGWLTSHQATELGGTLRKGEGKNYIPIVWWGRKVYGADRNGTAYVDASGNPTTKTAWILRASYVYNVAQFEGLPARLTPPVPVPVVGFDAARAIVDASGIVVRHGGSRAFYRPSDDAVTMPMPQSFVSEGAYLATLFHELTHATGHVSRCDRPLSGAFGSAGYAAEELVAELGAAFLCAHAGVDAEPREDHAAYVASWLRALKGDKTAIFTAAKLARVATDWLIARVPGAEVAGEDEESLAAK